MSKTEYIHGGCDYIHHQKIAPDAVDLLQAAVLAKMTTASKDISSSAPKIEG